MNTSPWCTTQRPALPFFTSSQRGAVPASKWHKPNTHLSQGLWTPIPGCGEGTWWSHLEWAVNWQYIYTYINIYIYGSIAAEVGCHHLLSRHSALRWQSRQRWAKPLAAVVPRLMDCNWRFTRPSWNSLLENGWKREGLRKEPMNKGHLKYLKGVKVQPPGLLLVVDGVKRSDPWEDSTSSVVFDHASRACRKRSDDDDDDDDDGWLMIDDWWLMRRDPDLGALKYRCNLRISALLSCFGQSPHQATCSDDIKRHYISLYNHHNLIHLSVTIPVGQRFCKFISYIFQLAVYAPVLSSWPRWTVCFPNSPKNWSLPSLKLTARPFVSQPSNFRGKLFVSWMVMYPKGR